MKTVLIKEGRLCINGIPKVECISFEIASIEYAELVKAITKKEEAVYNFDGKVVIQPVQGNIQINEYFIKVVKKDKQGIEHQISYDFDGCKLLEVVDAKIEYIEKWMKVEAKKGQALYDCTGDPIVPETKGTIEIEERFIKVIKKEEILLYDKKGTYILKAEDILLQGEWVFTKNAVYEPIVHDQVGAFTPLDIITINVLVRVECRQSDGEKWEAFYSY